MFAVSPYHTENVSRFPITCSKPLDNIFTIKPVVGRDLCLKNFIYAPALIKPTSDKSCSEYILIPFALVYRLAFLPINCGLRYMRAFDDYVLPQINTVPGARGVYKGNDTLRIRPDTCLVGRYLSQSFHDKNLLSLSISANHFPACS